ncbi:hypothetical protein [Paenibacillus elgii]|uniref:hypothetical protein n=1 Tax=Paenibacillus elgii TaxID=189691 RepID=UPI003B43C2B3
MQGVKLILDNPIYIGKIRYNQVENWSEKRRFWETVQNIRKKRAFRPTSSLS